MKRLLAIAVLSLAPSIGSAQQQPDPDVVAATLSIRMQQEKNDADQATYKWQFAVKQLDAANARVADLEKQLTSVATERDKLKAAAVTPVETPAVASGKQPHIPSVPPSK